MTDDKPQIALKKNMTPSNQIRLNAALDKQTGSMKIKPRNVHHSLTHDHKIKEQSSPTRINESKMGDRTRTGSEVRKQLNNFMCKPLANNVRTIDDLPSNISEDEWGEIQKFGQRLHEEQQRKHKEAQQKKVK